MRLDAMILVFLMLKFFFLIFIFIYLVAQGLSCGMWDLVPQPGIKRRVPALRAQSLSHWTTRGVLNVEL